jgi:hypothetical protein
MDVSFPNFDLNLSDQTPTKGSEKASKKEKFQEL